MWSELYIAKEMPYERVEWQCNGPEYQAGLNKNKVKVAK